MFIATITHRNGTNGSGYKSTMEELNAWVEQTAATGMWGKKAGEYPLSQLSESELAQEISRKTHTEAIELVDPLIELPEQDEKPAGFFPLSTLTEDELLLELSRKTHTEPVLLMEPLITIPAQYTIEITDITAEVEQEKTNANALAYLSSTDWYAIREAETGVKMPENIKQARAAARASIIK